MAPTRIRSLAGVSSERARRGNKIGWDIGPATTAIADPVCIKRRRSMDLEALVFIILLPKCESGT